MPSFSHYAMVAVLLALLAGCNNGEIRYSGDTSASENQKNLATAGSVGYFATVDACLSVAPVSFTVPVRSTAAGSVRNRLRVVKETGVAVRLELGGGCFLKK